MRDDPAKLRPLIAVGAIAAPTLHSITDLMELLGGGFFPIQLGLNYLAFVAMPFVLLGLYAVQRPRAGWMALAGALAYGVAFVYFAGTATYALARHTSDYEILLRELGIFYTAHGALMVVGGVLFGMAIVRARVLPRWTGLALTGGVLINLVVAIVALPPIVQIAGSAVRNVAFAGMGICLLTGSAADRHRAEN